MTRSTFMYVSYIRTTPERLWSALTRDTEFMKQYWFGNHGVSEWTEGSTWRNISAAGEVLDSGFIVEASPPTRLVIRWRHESKVDLREEGDSTCTIDIEPLDATVKLSITHTMERGSSKLIEAVSGGWPKVVSNLKSLLETGAPALVAPYPIPQKAMEEARL